MIVSGFCFAIFGGAGRTAYRKGLDAFREERGLFQRRGYEDFRNLLGSGSQGALGSVETGLFSGGIPFDFVAQERECEGARPVDDLSPVGAALFEQGHGTVRAGYGHPDRADGFLFRAARRTCDAGGCDGIVGSGGAACSFGHLPCDLLTDGAPAGNRFGIDTQQVAFGFVAVSHHSAQEIGRCSGYCREAGRDAAARAALGRGETSADAAVSRLWTISCMVARSNPRT